MYVARYRIWLDLSSGWCWFDSGARGKGRYGKIHMKPHSPLASPSLVFSSHPLFFVLISSLCWQAQSPLSRLLTQLPVSSPRRSKFPCDVWILIVFIHSPSIFSFLLLLTSLFQLEMFRSQLDTALSNLLGAGGGHHWKTVCRRASNMGFCNPTCMILLWFCAHQEETLRAFSCEIPANFYSIVFKS